MVGQDTTVVCGTDDCALVVSALMTVHGSSDPHLTTANPLDPEVREQRALFHETKAFAADKCNLSQLKQVPASPGDLSTHQSTPKKARPSRSTREEGSGDVDDDGTDERSPIKNQDGKVVDHYEAFMKSTLSSLSIPGQPQGSGHGGGPCELETSLQYRENLKDLLYGTSGENEVEDEHQVQKRSMK